MRREKKETTGSRKTACVGFGGRNPESRGSGGFRLEFDETKIRAKDKGTRREL